MERVAFADVVAVVIDYLSSELTAWPGIHVGSRVPATRPSQFVRVDRVGGARDGLVRDRASVITEAWADSQFTAYQLANDVRSIVGGMSGEIIAGVVIYRVSEFGGPATLPDPVSDQARVTQTFSIETRGFAA